MNEKQRVDSFKAMVEESKGSNYYFEEIDGDLQQWRNLSDAAKLQYIATYAAHDDVPFKPFAEAVNDLLSDVRDAALRVVFDYKKELRALEKLLPEDWGTESTPLVERFNETLNSGRELTANEQELERALEIRKAHRLDRDDPAFNDLITEIQSVLSARFVEDPDRLCSPFYMPSNGEPGFEFASLNRADRLELISEMVDWRGYDCRGITGAQLTVIIGNVMDGKPQDRWLEGVFDPDVEKAAFRNLLHEDRPMAKEVETKDRGRDI